MVRSSATIVSAIWLTSFSRFSLRCERAQQLDLRQGLQLAGGRRHMGVRLRAARATRSWRRGPSPAPWRRTAPRRPRPAARSGSGIVGERGDAAGHGQRASGLAAARTRAHRRSARCLAARLAGLRHQDRELLAAHPEGRVGGPQHGSRPPTATRPASGRPRCGRGRRSAACSRPGRTRPATARPRQRAARSISARAARGRRGGRTAR